MGQERVIPSGDVLQEALASNTVYDAKGKAFALQGAGQRGPVQAAGAGSGARASPKLSRSGWPWACRRWGILYALDGKEGARHLAVDPYQQTDLDYFDPSQPPPTDDGYGGVGLAMVERANLGHLLEFDGRHNYLALPDLVSRGRRFDLIFIDGYHTFDYAFIDYFYADLLLRDGGYLVFDDWMLPNVHKVCWFLETHKDYELVGPDHDFPLKPSFQARMWLQRKLGRRAPRNGHPQWGSIMAYRKRSTTMARPLHFHSSFYPYFRRWWALKRLRSGVARIFGGPVVKKPPPWE